MKLGKFIRLPQCHCSSTFQDRDIEDEGLNRPLSKPSPNRMHKMDVFMQLKELFI